MTAIEYPTPAAKRVIASLGAPKLFESAPDLLADAELDYYDLGVALPSSQVTNAVVVPGAFLGTRLERFSYVVAESDATDQHVTTAGGVKLYVLPGDAGYDVRAFGATEGGTVDCYTHLVAAIAAVPSTGGRVYLPGKYRISQTVYIQRSNIVICGDGRYKSFLVPDEASTVANQGHSFGFQFRYNLLFVGTAQGRLVNVGVQELGIDGTNKPVDDSGGFGRIAFQFCDYCSAFNLYQFGCHNFIDVTKSTQVQISYIHCRDNAEGVVSFFQDVEDATISGILGINVDELVDLADNKRISISDCVGVAPSGSTEEMIDVGHCEDVTITNCVFVGGYYGIDIKNETAAYDDGFRNITISNCIFRDYKRGGVKVNIKPLANAGAGDGRKGDNLTVSNCVFDSAEIEGLYALHMQEGTLDTRNLCFTGNVINLPNATGGIAIQLKNVVSAMISNNQVVASNKAIDLENARQCRILDNLLVSSGVTVTGDDSSTLDVDLRGNRIRSNTLGAIAFTDLRGYTRVVDNQISYSAGGYAIDVRNCTRPTVSGNAIDECDKSGIRVQFSGDDALDVTDLNADWALDRNTVKDWGQDGLNNRVALHLELKPTTVGEYVHGSMVGNRTVLSSASTAGASLTRNTYIELGSGVNLGYTSIISNTWAKGATHRTALTNLSGTRLLILDELTNYGQAITPGLKAGLYLPTVPTTSISTSAAPGNASLRLHPVWIPREITIDRLACEVVTAGNTGCFVRMGIYSDDGTGYPGSLVLDAGQIAADVSGVKTSTISVTLTPGFYWFGLAVQLAGSLQPVMRTATVAVFSPVGFESLAGADSGAAYSEGSVSGALPATFSTTIAQASTVFRMFYRVVAA